MDLDWQGVAHRISSPWRPPRDGQVTVSETFDLLTLALLPGVGPRSVRDLATRGSVASALAHPEEHADLLPPRALLALRSGEARRRAEDEARRAAALGIRIVGRDEEDYPPLLQRIYDPPPVLYLRGTLVRGDGPAALAVVGSRAASSESTILTRAMARDLAATGVTIVSGLARGIDTAAHLGALDGGGRTVAILGSGLDRVYPGENRDLAAAVAEQGGAVVSEFPLGTTPYAGNFPRRNRVIAGWGRAVVVVEAAARSGALSTARAALEEGREVLAVPGHPSASGATGTNQLIRDGAVLVRNALDVALEMGLPFAVSSPGVSVTDDVLCLLPRDAPASLEELHARAGRPIAEVLARLTELEVAAKIRRLPGSLYVRA